MADLVRTRNRYDHNGDIRFLGDLEHTIVKGKHFFAPVPGAFGIDADRNRVRFYEVCCLIDGHDCFSGIFPVNWQEAAFADNASEHGNFEILRLGHKGKIIVLEYLPCEDGIVIGSVIADQQEAGVRRNFLHSGHMDTDTQQLDRCAAGSMQQPTVKAAVLRVFTLWVYKQAAD